ncbi:DNA polymerase delta catalytic subunit [Dissostichus eleginoides]|uniref:DNA polymerase delta catalytic subunit n=1 Tax=Dissostichus eleginoides TaxID=100907 RepID=A0AAD9B766_DISEL|nr:DNA polymerase delta catalytic subunit [Dissostichus eleginoides]
MEAFPPGSDQLLSWENHALRSAPDASRGYNIQALNMAYIHVFLQIWLMGAVGNIMTFIRSPPVVHSSPTSKHIWFDHLPPRPLPATPACTSSILCVIIATLLAIAKVSHDTKT